jgi:hypothetical protein
MLLSIVVALTGIPTKNVCVLATFSPALIVVITLDYGHSNWSEMKSKCCFDLHLFYNQGS